MKKATLLMVATLFISSTLWAGTLSPTSIDGAVTISVEEAKELFDSEVLFVDVRKDSDWDAGRIPGAIHLDNKKGVLSEASLSSEVGKNEKLVMYCNGPKCMRSSKGSASAVSWGFTDVYYFRGGFPAWKDAGYPVE